MGALGQTRKMSLFSSSFCATLSKKLDESNHLTGIYQRINMAEMTIFVENDQNRVKITTFRLKQDFSHDIHLLFFKVDTKRGSYV